MCIFFLKKREKEEVHKAHCTSQLILNSVLQMHFSQNAILPACGMLVFTFKMKANRARGGVFSLSFSL